MFAIFEAYLTKIYKKLYCGIYWRAELHRCVEGLFAEVGQVIAGIEFGGFLKLDMA